NQERPAIINDGSGGAIITWHDYRDGNWDIYARMVDASGTPQWAANGVAISTASSNQFDPTIASDGSGGAIIAWQDYRNGHWDIYARRVNSSGTPQWAANGVAICTAAAHQQGLSIVSDNSGGAIITWHDYRGGMSNIYAQRVNASGTPQWNPDGVIICSSPWNQLNPTITSDDSGGAIITWHDYRSNSDWDIYAQKVNDSGNIQWPVNGVAICTTSKDQQEPVIISDGSNGALIAWQDYRNDTWDVYAQNVDTSGSPLWTANGVAVSTESGNQRYPTIVSDGSGGAIIGWEDRRSGSNYDIYTQRVATSGVPQWTANGTPICIAASNQQNPAIVSDGSGGAIITWQDYRDGLTNANIYSQRVNTDGSTLWAADGVTISNAANNQRYPVIVSDGAGGAIVTWEDYRIAIAGIYAQRVNADGLLQAVPAIISVDPDKGAQDATLDVTITGTNLTGTSAVDFGAGITVNGFTVDDSNQITASITIDAAATVGTRDVSVTNPDGTDTLTDGFTVGALPTITSVDPNQDIRGTTLDVTITGTDFTDASAVDFSAEITVDGFTVDDPSQITATITIDAGAAIGTRDVSVTNPFGTGNLTDSFTVGALPSITSIDPSEDIRGATLDVTITGTDFTDASAVDFSTEITVDGFTVDDPSQITATITIDAGAAIGTRDVSVTNPYGTGNLTDGFTVNEANSLAAPALSQWGIIGMTGVFMVCILWALRTRRPRSDTSL
ncbi:MAG: hypothetical protein SVO26_03830, partial [Chloroflexota bacterium]|nr:hypothetical protein [Chloroflexota bacterium]